ncbi:helix-turn-helix transcriptional regulator [Tabrizicola sp. M-4]|uniref:helix-turn-helix transcriptional regulator n=1 Tax=Tabrizicola sp. M-4 TaxID=3055847 RepID=UPI003DA8B481
MTHLGTHISETGKSQAALAKDLGISRSHMSELVSGAKKPSLELAFAIERATGGAVPASAWVDDQQKAS